MTESNNWKPIWEYFFDEFCANAPEGVACVCVYDRYGNKLFTRNVVRRSPEQDYLFNFFKEEKCGDASRCEFLAKETLQRLEEFRKKGSI